MSEGTEKKFTQEELDAYVEKRLKREQDKFEKEKKELERKHNESIEDYEERIKNANLTAEEKHQKALEKIQKELEAKNTELTTIKTNEVKKSMLAKYKLSEKFLNRITGSTEEEIENSVKEFSEAIGEFLKSKGAGTLENMNGGSKDEQKVQLESLKKRAMETGSAEDRAAYIKAKTDYEENSGGN